MKKWLMAKSAAVKVSLVVACALVVAAIGTGIYFGVKPASEKAGKDNVVVSISDDTTPLTDAPAVEEDSNESEEVTEAVSEPVADDVTEEAVEEQPEERVKEGYDLVNGNFADGLFAYEMYAMNENDIYYDVNDSGLTVHIADTGTEDWHVQLKQSDVRLEKGRWYRLSLSAKSDINRSITYTMMHNGLNDDNWTLYAPSKKIDLTSNWQTYSVIFQMNEATDNHSVFNISMGTIDGRRITSNHAISINNIKLEVLPVNFTDTMRSGDNLIGNANFDYGEILWDASVVAPGQSSVSFDGNKVTFGITNPGTVDWHVQLKQAGINLEGNTGYHVSFNVSSTESRIIKLGVMDTNYVTWYGGGDIQVGPGTQTVSVDFFNSYNANPNAILMISMGKIEGVSTPASTITLSNFYMVKDSGVTAASAGGNAYAGGKNPTTVLGAWEVYDHECGHTAGSYTDSEGAYVIKMTNLGTEAWHAQMTNKSLNLEKGKTYKISFWGKSTVERDITYQVQHNGNLDNNWTTYTSQNTASLTTEFKEYHQVFTMNNNDFGAVFNFSFGKQNANDNSAVPHTVYIKDIVFEEVVYNGPEKTETGYIVRDTNEVTTDEYGSKWVVNLDAADYIENPQHKNLVVSAKIKSEGSFDGIMGACYGDAWAWTDSQFKVNEAGEVDVTLNVNDFMGALQIQINKMSADSVEISDITITEATESEDDDDTEDNDNPEKDYVAIINDNTPKNDGGNIQLDLPVDQSLIGKKVLATVELESEADFNGMLGGCNTSSWSWTDTGTLESKDGKAVWQYEFYEMQGAFQVQIFWKGAENIYVKSVTFTEVTEETPSEPETPAHDVITITNNKGEYVINPVAYGVSEPAGKVLKIAATLKGDNLFKGAIGGNSPAGWAQSQEFVSNNGEEVTFEYTLDSYVDFVKVDIWWAEATAIEVVNVTVTDVTPATPAEEETPADPESSAVVVNVPDVVIAADAEKTADGNWEYKIESGAYPELEGKTVKFSADLQSDSYYGGKIIIQSHEDYSGWNASEQIGVEATGEVSHWEVTAEDYKQAFIQLYWRDEQNNPSDIYISNIKLEVVDDEE